MVTVQDRETAQSKMTSSEASKSENTQTVVATVARFDNNSNQKEHDQNRNRWNSHGWIRPRKSQSDKCTVWNCEIFPKEGLLAFSNTWWAMEFPLPDWPASVLEKRNRSQPTLQILAKHKIDGLNSNWLQSIDILIFPFTLKGEVHSPALKRSSPVQCLNPPDDFSIIDLSEVLFGYWEITLCSRITLLTFSMRVPGPDA